ncbi:MAG TPA: Holliday junction resolvase RuvX [Actinomycetes bacterium]|nr:Holliday junction resolvase RuvX [Actinomycetes bacterium]
MRRGVRVAVDVGSVRVGVAVSDPDGLVATPLRTVARGKGRDAGADLAEIAAVVAERDAFEVIVGLPIRLQGDEGPAAAAARDYATALAAQVAPVPVRLVDERLSTAAATRGLRDTGVRGRKSRTVIDQAAAVLILQGALDAERASGRPCGEHVPAPPAAGGPDEAEPTAR